MHAFGFQADRYLIFHSFNEKKNEAKNMQDKK